MIQEKMKTCPLCPRACDLETPHCERGKMIAKSGVFPEKQMQEHHQDRLVFENRKQQLIMKYLHHAVGAADRGGFTQAMTNEMFSVLSEEETQTLAMLLEKLSDHWVEIAPVKPAHHKKK